MYVCNTTDRSCVTNATYQTGAQSKVSGKIQPSHQTVQPAEAAEHYLVSDIKRDIPKFGSVFTQTGATYDENT